MGGRGREREEGEEERQEEVWERSYMYIRNQLGMKLRIHRMVCAVQPQTCTNQ